MNRQPVILAMLIISAVVAGCRANTATTQPTRIEEQLCADGIATVFAWEDSNGNGFRDGVEPPLGGVGISIHNYRGVTEADGKWASGLIFGACGSPDEVGARMAAQCRSLPVSASPPAGYAPTTETEVHGCDVRFGFMRVPTSSPSVMPVGPGTREPTTVVASCEIG